MAKKIIKEEILRKKRTKHKRTTLSDVDSIFAGFFKNIVKGEPYKISRIAEETGLHPNVVKSRIETITFILNEYPPIKVLRNRKGKVDFIIVEDTKEDTNELIKKLIKIMTNKIKG